MDLESGVRGHVREIAMRYIRVTTHDEIDILVRNSPFIDGRVINWTHNDAYTRLHAPFGVTYGAPKEQVKEAAVRAAHSLAGVLQDAPHAPDVWLVSFGDNAVNCELVLWVQRKLTAAPASTQAQLWWTLDDEPTRVGIATPFPQRDLHLRCGTLDGRIQRPD